MTDVDDVAAAAAKASATLIVSSRRSRGRRNQRSRKDDLEDERKEDERKEQEEKEKRNAELDAKTQAQKKLKEDALQAAERRAAEMLIELEKVKQRVFGIFENEVERFNATVRLTKTKLDKAAIVADREKITKELTTLMKLDRETELLYDELQKIAKKGRKPKTKDKGEKKETENKGGSKKEKDKQKKTKSKSKSRKDSNDKETSGGSAVVSSTKSGKGPRLDSKIKKILNEIPPQLVSACVNICKKRTRAYSITAKHVRDVISACGDPSLIEDILERKFSLFTKEQQEKREARGEKNHSRSVMSKDELAGVAGGYPICTAARQGQHNVCKQLLTLMKGDSVNMLDANGLPPLLLAARAGYDLLTKFLLDFGAFADAVDSGRANALMLAARQEDRFYQAERQRRTDLQKVFAKSKKGGDSAEGGGQHLQFRPLEKNYTRVLKLLIAVGANFNHRDMWGKSVLTHAAECGNHEGARLLLRVGARVNSADNEKQWTSIHYAVFNSHFFTAHDLIKGGANVDVVDDNGITPLILAVDDGKERLVELLVHSGANTGLTSVYGQSCASLALDRGDTTVLDIIRNGVPESYDPNTTIILVKTIKGIVKRRRKKKKKKKKEKEGDESKLSNELLDPSPVNDDLVSANALEDVMKINGDDSGIEDVRDSDEEYVEEDKAEAEAGAEAEAEDDVRSQKK